MASQATEKVLFERDGKVGIVRLNRPRIMNCLDPDTLGQLRGHFEFARSEKRIRVLLVCGNGRAFSAGADLKYAKDKDAEALRAFNQVGLVDAFHYIQKFPKPTIAVVDGYALGGGLELALSCDFRFASKEHAIFGFPEIDLGILPTWGGMYLPLEIIGTARTLEIVLTGARIDADTAYKMGLVHKVFPHEDLFKEALSFAKILARKGSFLLQLGKHIIKNSIMADDEERLRLSTLASDLIRAGEQGEARLNALLDEEKS